jgi:hypothetical protein
MESLGLCGISKIFVLARAEKRMAAAAERQSGPQYQVSPTLIPTRLWTLRMKSVFGHVGRPQAVYMFFHPRLVASPNKSSDNLIKPHPYKKLAA